jgi:hypothetical protein
MTDAAQVGQLVIEQRDLSRRISALREDARRRGEALAAIVRKLFEDPERLAFIDQKIDERFADGITLLDGAAADLAILREFLDTLRAAIARRDDVQKELTDFGVPAGDEDETLQQRSRALHLPALPATPRADEAARAIGFHSTRKK